MPSTLPFTEQQCFFVAMLAFAIVGFRRGWKREVVTLIFVLLAFFLINRQSAEAFDQFLGRVPNVVSVIMTGATQPVQSPTFLSGMGTWGLLMAFGLIVALGYYVGLRAFPAAPGTPLERFIGVVPAIISGAFMLVFLRNNFFVPTNSNVVVVPVLAPDPGKYVSALFVIAILSVVVGLVWTRAKKATAKK